MDSYFRDILKCILLSVYRCIFSSTKQDCRSTFGEFLRVVGLCRRNTNERAFVLLFSFSLSLLQLMQISSFRGLARKKLSTKSRTLCLKGISKSFMKIIIYDKPTKNKISRSYYLDVSVPILKKLYTYIYIYVFRRKYY